MKLKNLFKKKLKTGTKVPGRFKIEHINPGADTLHDALGISDKRCKELSDIVKFGFTKCDDSVKVAKYFTDECLHINEFFFCVYILSANVESNNRKASLMDILSNKD